MIGHVRKVHDKMYQPKERLFECEECNKKFYKKFHLQRHIRVHTGELMFVYSSHFSPVVHTVVYVAVFCIFNISYSFKVVVAFSVNLHEI